MLRALGEFEIEGLKTLIPFHTALLQTEQWARGETCRDLLEDKDWLKALAFPKVAKPDGDDDDSETVEQTYTVEVSGRKFDVKVIGPPPVAGAAPANGAAPAAPRPKRAERQNGRKSTGSGDALSSPMQGSIWKVPVKQGQQVAEGDVVTIIEAMKMENEITAHKAGVIAELPIREGDSIASGDTLAVIVDETH
jgi:acetyl-CoA/propionyl-CoA carboxylase biotin carboxyl carrier protein